MLPAFTRTDPAAPELPPAASLLTLLAKFPASVPSTVRAPLTFSATSPALPDLKASLLIEPPRVRINVPALTVTLPEAPGPSLLPAIKEDASVPPATFGPVPLMVASSVTLTEISAPRPVEKVAPRTLLPLATVSSLAVILIAGAFLLL